MQKKFIEWILSNTYKAIKDKETIQDSNNYINIKNEIYMATMECTAKQAASMVLGLLLDLLNTYKNNKETFVAYYDLYIEFCEFAKEQEVQDELFVV